MADIIRFVDSIAASPTTLLDVNDEVLWRCRSFSAPPPRLRRSSSSNVMRDGGVVSSSTYDMRTVTMRLDLLTTTQDANATELQKLARLLDKESGYLMYQPTGATKPVFFRYFRSDISGIEDVIAQAAFRKPEIELPCDPFALGAREDMGPYTVNNDPAAGSNPCYFDVTGVKGDVPAPVVWLNTSRSPARQYIAVRQHGTPSDLIYFRQAELADVLDTDTTNPGGGPDADMSGSTSNNFARTSFATDATMVRRLSLTMPSGGPTLVQQIAMRGTYRVLVAVRRSSAVGGVNVAFDPLMGLGLPAVATKFYTGRQIVDLGLITLGTIDRVGHDSAHQPIDPAQVDIAASRTSGTSTLDWDFVLFMPADEAQCIADGMGTASYDEMLDGITGLTQGVIAAGAPFSGDAEFLATLPSNVGATGALPKIAPEQTNRIFYFEAGVLAGGGLDIPAWTKGDSNAITLSYWPQYLYIRPSTS
jgi:hypothetical protein